MKRKILQTGNDFDTTYVFTLIIIFTNALIKTNPAQHRVVSPHFSLTDTCVMFSLSKHSPFCPKAVTRTSEKHFWLSNLGVGLTPMTSGSKLSLSNTSTPYTAQRSLATPLPSWNDVRLSATAKNSLAMLLWIFVWTSFHVTCLFSKKLALRSAKNSWCVTLWFTTPFFFMSALPDRRAEESYSSKKAIGLISFSARFTCGVLCTRSSNGARDLTVTAYCRQKRLFLHHAVWKQSVKESIQQLLPYQFLKWAGLMQTMTFADHRPLKANVLSLHYHKVSKIIKFGKICDKLKECHI